MFFTSLFKNDSNNLKLKHKIFVTIIFASFFHQNVFIQLIISESLDENISLQQHTETSSESSGDDGKTAEPGKTVRMEDNESKLQLEAHQFNIVPKLPKTQKILDILFQRNKHSKKKVYDNENGAQLNFNLSMDSESSKLIVTVIKVK